MYFLGVDGGGTKTAFVLVDGSGKILGRAHRPSTYYFGRGLDIVAGILADGIASVCGQAGIEPSAIDRAFFGLPGYGEASTDTSALDALPRAPLGHDRYACGNDMICGWAGSLGGTDGINIIAGTGSMTYGERQGRRWRVGGWGELFGDEGSGYWIAAKGLNAFSRMSDGRLPRGPLYEFVKTRADVEFDLDLIDVVFTRWKKDRTEIAKLSTTVVEAGSQGDAVARRILAEAHEELIALVDTTRNALDFDDHEAVPVSFSGGMFESVVFRTGFANALKNAGPKYDLRLPLFKPDVGAAIYAAIQAGTPLRTSALEPAGGLLRGDTAEHP